MVDNSELEKKINRIDSRILTSLRMLELAFNNSRAYSDTVDTEEKRIEQTKRLQKALDSDVYRQASAYWNPNSNRRNIGRK